MSEQEVPHPGDIIEIDEHTVKWAVYIGDGNVVYVDDDSAYSYEKESLPVVMAEKDSLLNVVGTSEWRINNSWDSEYPPRLPEIIIEEAASLMESELIYSHGFINNERFATCLRYGKLLSRQDKNPKPGDRIEVFRGLYQHWAVYIGESDVVHLTALNSFSKRAGESAIEKCTSGSASSETSSPPETAIVTKQKLSEVVGTDDWRVNNTLDKDHTPLHPEVIVENAVKRVGEKMSYKVFTKNCEHLATELRYGQPLSQQSIHFTERKAPFVLKTTGAVLLGVPAVAGAALSAPVIGLGAAVGLGAAAAVGAGAVAGMAAYKLLWGKKNRGNDQ